jgi:hypothetical protein
MAEEQCCRFDENNIIPTYEHDIEDGNELSKCQWCCGQVCINCSNSLLLGVNLCNFVCLKILLTRINCKNVLYFKDPKSPEEELERKNRVKYVELLCYVRNIKDFSLPNSLLNLVVDYL